MPVQLYSTSSNDIVEKLDISFLPEAAVSGPVLLQDDHHTFLTFNAVKMPGEDKRGPSGIGIVKFDLCSTTKFGYPNDEALGGHPLSKSGLGFYGVFEVKRSSWVKQVTEQNRVCFPDTPDDTDTRHFVFTFHDSTFECLANGVSAHLDTRPFHEIIAELTAKLTNE